MKKTLRTLALVFVLLFAVSSVALAAGSDKDQYLTGSWKGVYMSYQGEMSGVNSLVGVTFGADHTGTIKLSEEITIDFTWTFDHSDESAHIFRLTSDTNGTFWVDYIYNYESLEGMIVFRFSEDLYVLFGKAD